MAPPHGKRASEYGRPASTAIHAVTVARPPADIADARACAGSNVELAEVAEHFAVKLPADAAGLRFASGFNPFFGEYNLTVLFRTTPGGLRTLIADSGFAQPKAVDPSTVLSDVACPGPLTFRRGLATEIGARSLVVETSDPTRPLVYIEAADL
jgi:hypothetical protein